MSDKPDQHSSSGASTKPSSDLAGSTETKNQRVKHPAYSKPNVSRETLPLEGQDLLNQIMDRAMPDLPDPEEETSKEAPENANDSDQPQNQPPEKNKPSSVYIYLAILFGAAFLMLLLAYFVHQRNNACAPPSPPARTF